MSNSQTEKKTMTDVVGMIVNELSLLTPDERQRVIRASLALLGEEPVKPNGEDAEAIDTSGGEPDKLHPRARNWGKQNAVSVDQLHQIFQIDGEDVEVIASNIPGRNNREKVRNAYVLTGLARFLSSGEAKFADKDARTLCEKYGFYDSSNHSKHMRGGNEFTGSGGSWTLTIPGLKAGAAIIREITSES